MQKTFENHVFMTPGSGVIPYQLPSPTGPGPTRNVSSLALQVCMCLPKAKQEVTSWFAQNCPSLSTEGPTSQETLPSWATQNDWSPLGWIPPGTRWQPERSFWASPTGCWFQQQPPRLKCRQEHMRQDTGCVQYKTPAILTLPLDQPDIFI